MKVVLEEKYVQQQSNKIDLIKKWLSVLFQAEDKAVCSVSTTKCIATKQEDQFDLKLIKMNIVKERK